VSNTWTLGAVGDVFLNRPNPSEALQPVGAPLAAVDILFGNCEGVFTAAPHYAPTAGFRLVAKPANAEPLIAQGFDVLSFANNHTVDAGHEALLSMLAWFRQRGVATIGAGLDVTAARQSVTLEVNGVRVAFLAFTSVYQAGYEARGNVPGVAAIRVHTHYYVPSDGYARVEPGCRPHVMTYVVPEDERAFAAAIGCARANNDVVVVSCHWGESTKSASLTDYERRLGHLAIESGADAVLGHHHHMLRGIEIHSGKPIFYGLGHFAFDMAGMEALSPVQIAKWREVSDYVIYPREGYPLLPFHPDTRMTMIAVCEFQDRVIERAGFVPSLINAKNQPVPVALESEAGQTLLEYMQRISSEAGLATDYDRSDLLVGGCNVIEAR
jgi:poly-gamma-glutamate synthesis protein (capsule biosynthesis protein)